MSRGQALAVFAIFLVVLLGAAALAIDYANWLLTDRALQNVSDHSALAGASVYRQTISGTNCKEDPDNSNCRVAARVQAWTSLNQELNLGLGTGQIGSLASRDSPAGGDMGPVGSGSANFRGQTIWVSVPPPSRSEYTNIPGNPVGHGRLANQQGVVFARVDRPTRSYLAGVFGIDARARVGWATAGFLPNDFALEIFCRDGTNPNDSNSACVSKGVGIEGQGGITLIKGDIGSNESLQVSAQTGQGVILEDGNMFLANVSDTCGPSTWNCPPATTGGITDGSGNAKDAFYIPPQPYLPFASPLDWATPIGDTTVPSSDCNGANASKLCVPFQGDWACDNSNLDKLCGYPTVITAASGLREVSCQARAPWTSGNDLLPKGDWTGGGLDTNGFDRYLGSVLVSGGGDRYPYIDDDPTKLDPDTNPTPANPSADYISTSNLGIGGSGKSGAFFLTPGGPREPGTSTIRFVAFKTNAGAPTDTGNPVTLQVTLYQGSNSLYADPTVRTLTSVPTRYEFVVPIGTITSYNDLRLRFDFLSPSGDNTSKRGGAIAWAELQAPDPSPSRPPMIPPGYYHSITVPGTETSRSCAILDPTGVYSTGLKAYQMPGIYRFGTGNNDASITIGAYSYLIGDGVSLVFDPGFPDPTGGKGVVIGANGALVINTARTVGSPPCTAESESLSYNPSAPLDALPVSAICAAWAVDVNNSATPRPGRMNWVSTDGTTTTQGYCDPVVLGNRGPFHCVERTNYSPASRYRGVSFFFMTNTWPPSDIASRFQISGTSGSEPGVAFRGIMYAPWDDVKLTGGNGFNTIGQIFAWTAKFAGQSTIYLDYPYARCEGADACLPYLLEPTLKQ